METDAAVRPRTKQYMTLETIISAVLAGAGFVFCFVFRAGCGLTCRGAVGVVFGTPRTKLFVRLLGAIYLVSGAILLIFVLLAGVE